MLDGRRERDFGIRVGAGGKTGVVSQGSSDGEGPGCKAEGTSWSCHAPRGCSKHPAPAGTMPRAVPWGVPVVPSTDCGREAVVPSSQLQIWHFKLLLSAIFKVFSTLQKFLKSEESRKRHPWDAALGNLRRGCRFSKGSCGAAGSAGGQTGS